MRRTLYDDDHEAFRATVRTFVDKEIAPHVDEWSAAGITPRELFTAAGRQGLLGMDVPEEYGGGGVRDFRFNAVLGEECCDAGRRRRARDHAAQRHLPALLPQLLHRRAEAALAARHRLRRADHRDRA